MHELGHYGEVLDQAQTPRKQVPESKACEKCVVFAHIAGAVHSEAPRLPIPDLAYAPPQALQVARIAADRLSPRNRGPPTLL